MSAITVGGDIVHYEVLGRGRPVVLVHGWVGSWRYWIPVMQQLHLKYRVYALDLFGFGDSAKNPEKYTIDHQVNLLVEFMSQLGLTKAALIGHGLGAQVVAEFANHHREMVHRMLIASAPLFDTGDLTTRGQQRLLTTHDFDARRATMAAEASTPAPSAPHPTSQSAAAQTRLDERSGMRGSGGSSASGGSSDPTLAHRGDSPSSAAEVTVPNAKNLDRARLEAAALARAEAEISARRTGERPQVDMPSSSTGRIVAPHDNPLFGKIGRMNSETLLIKCFKKTEPEYSKLTQDVAKQDDAVLTRVTGNFDPGKLLDILRSLPMPVVVVHGTEDPIIDAPNDNIWTYITTQKEDLLAIPLPGVRHFPMLEADSFIRLVGNFLEIPDISKLEIKERWRRRSR
jgi:pimeloyl-ACP methyl ester carboxylesterase